MHTAPVGERVEVQYRRWCGYQQQQQQELMENRRCEERHSRKRAEDVEEHGKGFLL